MRAAVLFPGLGYTCDKPLLYYSGKVAAARGYRVIPVPYGGFPRGVKGDAEKLRACFESACDQSAALLAGEDWDTFDDIVFIGKSIGTAVAARYACERGLRARQVLLTPLAETFRWALPNALAFHGTADPWADTPTVQALCAERNIPLRLTPGANHSLETGDVAADLRILAGVVAAVDAYIKTL